MCCGIMEGMDLDNAEFIAKHHAKAQTPQPDDQRGQSLAGISVALIFAIFSGTFFYIAFLSAVDDLTQIVATMALIASLASGYVVFNLFRHYILKARELTLIKEVMEGGLSARLITDSVGNLVFANRKFNELCEGVGTPSLETLSTLLDGVKESRLIFENLREEAEKGHVNTVEIFSSHNGQDRWFNASAQPISNYAGYIHWRIDDVTEKYINERALQEERAKLIDFADNAPVGFFSVDEDGRFLFANATFARWIGEDLKTLLKQGVLHTYLADPPDNAAPFDLVENSKARQVVEVRMKGTGGKTFLASINQAVVYEGENKVRTRAVVYDLTAEREMRRALQASEDRFQRFFEDAPLGIVQLDKKRTIIDCNNAFSDMMNAGSGTLEGRKFIDFIDAEAQNQIIKILNYIETDDYVELPVDITLTNQKNSVTTQMYAQSFSTGDNLSLIHI